MLKSLYSPTIIQVGSSTYISSPRDYDFVVVLRSVNMIDIVNLKNKILTQFFLKKQIRISSKIELRQGPFKIKGNLPHLHLLIHTNSTLESVSLLTRMRWLDTAEMHRGIKPIHKLLIFEKPTILSLRCSLENELSNILNSLNSNIIYYKKWVRCRSQRKRVSLVLKKHLLNNREEKIVYLYHVKSLLEYYLKLNKFNTFKLPYRVHKKIDSYEKKINNMNKKEIIKLITYIRRYLNLDNITSSKIPV